jgi:hypothetical protein
VGERRRAQVARYLDISVRVSGGRWGFARVVVVGVVVRAGLGTCSCGFSLSTRGVESRWVVVVVVVVVVAGLLPGNLLCRYTYMSCGRAWTSVARAVSVSCE